MPKLALLFGVLLSAPASGSAPCLPVATALRHDPQSQAAFHISVHDSLTGAAVSGVRLRTNHNRLDTRTDSAGVAVIQSGPAPAWVYATKLGYRPRIVMLRGDEKSVSITLVRLPVQLATQAVTTDQVPEWLYRRDRTVDARAGRAMGRVLLEADIAARGQHLLSQVLATIPGLRADGDFVYVPRAVGTSITRPCTGVVVYVDGSSLGLVEDVNRLARPGDLAAIEVFVGSATLPRAFAGPMSGCGVVALWTKR